MAGSKMTSKGQVTIPKAIRALLGVRPGDRVVFHTSIDGQVIVTPETIDIRALKGTIKPKRKGVTVEEMAEAIRHAGTR